MMRIMYSPLEFSLSQDHGEDNRKSSYHATEYRISVVIFIISDVLDLIQGVNREN